jgi:serpin B
VGMELTAVPETRNVFMADHPFIFIIQEKTTGNILFLGRVTDPTK